MRHVKLAAESHYPIRVRTSPRTTFRKRTYTNDKGAYTYCAGFHHILQKSTGSSLLWRGFLCSRS